MVCCLGSKYLQKPGVWKPRVYGIRIPSRELTYPTLGNHLQNAIFAGYVSSLEGIHIWVDLYGYSGYSISFPCSPRHWNHVAPVPHVQHQQSPVDELCPPRRTKNLGKTWKMTLNVQKVRLVPWFSSSLYYQIKIFHQPGFCSNKVSFLS